MVAGNVLYVYPQALTVGLQSLNPMTGQPISLYTFETGTEIGSEPMVSHGRIYIADNGQHEIQILAP